MPKIIQITGVRTEKYLLDYYYVDQAFLFGNKKLDSVELINIGQFKVETYFINADYIKEIIRWDNGAVVILDKNEIFSRENHYRDVALTLVNSTTPDYIYTSATVEELMKSING